MLLSSLTSGWPPQSKCWPSVRLISGPRTPQVQHSSGDFEGEQQGVNWSFYACSSNVKYRSRCSGSPSSTRVLQMPHTPCSHYMRISTPAFISASQSVWSLGITTILPELASFTSKLPPSSDFLTSAHKYS